jgi:hypothetical protein
LGRFTFARFHDAFSQGGVVLLFSAFMSLNREFVFQLDLGLYDDSGRVV